MLRRGWGVPSISGPQDYGRGRERCPTWTRASAARASLWDTHEEFADFILRVDWRSSSVFDNSGVFLRFPAPSAAAIPPTTGGSPSTKPTRSRSTPVHQLSSASAPRGDRGTRPVRLIRAMLRSLRCRGRPRRLPYPMNSFEPGRRDPDDAALSAPAPMCPIPRGADRRQVIFRRLGRV